MSKHDSDGSLGIDPEYGKRLLDELVRLRRVVDGREETLAELGRRAGLSRTTLHRLKHGEAAIKSAFEVRDWIAAHGGPDLPPPAVLVTDQADHEWIEVGRQLRTLDADRFFGTLRQAARILALLRDQRHIEKRLQDAEESLLDDEER